jgi:hypothetical protein
LAAFESFLSEDGVSDCDAWAFVDWGYVRNEGPVDIALNLHVLEAVRCMESWSHDLGHDERAAHYSLFAKRIEHAVRRWFESALPLGWDAVGFQRAALGVRLGLFAGTSFAEALAFMKRHILDCFPNDPKAPRLSDPSVASTRLISPYFAHYSLPPLIENGDMDFVLDQYRSCWGYALSLGITTTLEVFDTRWSHCHQWAACPTWQLSRYLLGLHPRFDQGERNFDFKLIPGSLGSASGRIPLPDGEAIDVSWRRSGDQILYEVATPGAATLQLGDRQLEIESKSTLCLEAAGDRWSPV